jgi:hypothetical protein
MWPNSGKLGHYQLMGSVGEVGAEALKDPIVDVLDGGDCARVEG